MKSSALTDEISLVDVTLSALDSEAEIEFQRRLGPKFTLVSSKVLGESHYRGGFTLEFSDGIRRVVATYGDLEFDVRIDGRELFGPANHGEFSGIMFSREHLREHLPHIVDTALRSLRDERSL